MDSTKPAMKIYAGPSRYVQGRGAFDLLAKEVRQIGLFGKALIVVSKTAEQQTRSKWEKGFAELAMDYSLFSYQGECTHRKIEEIVSRAKEEECSYMIAIGGGKTIDAARAAAEVLRMETVICPSIAATDAPCIAISVIYSEAGEMIECRCHKKNPLLVVVDTEVIAQAPKRFLVSGIGDALATYYEARTSQASFALNPRGGLACESGLALAKLCRDILFADAPFVVRTYDTQGITPAFERIVEANILLSGLGVELCHVAGAHAIHNGLTSLKETHQCYHGEKVAFGLLVQLILEGAPTREIEEILAFYGEVGLPSTFAQLGISHPTQEMLMAVAKRALCPGETIYHEPFLITPAMIVDALLCADAFSTAYAKRQK